MCDPNLCPDSPGGGRRCRHCPLDRLEAAEQSAAGQLLRRALDLLAVVKMGIRLSLDDIDADELYAMLVIEEERNRYDNEQAEKR